MRRRTDRWQKNGNEYNTKDEIEIRNFLVGAYHHTTQLSYLRKRIRLEYIDYCWTCHRKQMTSPGVCNLHRKACKRKITKWRISYWKMKIYLDKTSVFRTKLTEICVESEWKWKAAPIIQKKRVKKKKSGKIKKVSRNSSYFTTVFYGNFETLMNVVVQNFMNLQTIRKSQQKKSTSRIQSSAVFMTGIKWSMIFLRRTTTPSQNFLSISCRRLISQCKRPIIIFNTAFSEKILSEQTCIEPYSSYLPKRFFGKTTTNFFMASKKIENP